MIDLAADETAFGASRIAALRLCSKQGYAEALEVSRNIAQKEEASTALRSVAIATLGELGGDAEIGCSSYGHLPGWTRSR